MVGGEREITDPVDLCLPDGRLNPAAVGWSRRPLHRANLRGWGRAKRWEYWAILTPRHVISITAASVDYAGVHSLYVHDRVTGVVWSTDRLVPLAFGSRFAAGNDSRQASVRVKGLAISTDETRAGTWVRVTAPGVGIDVTMARPAGHESLGAVIPWSATRFQYTVKDVCRPVRGTLRLGPDTFTLDAAAVAILDHGRGKWPYAAQWNWAAGGNPVKRRGIQLGGSWTDGTPISENALLVDGRIHKIDSHLTWRYDRTDWLRPWSIRGERVSAEFHPFHLRVAQTRLGVLSSSIHQAYGEFTGRARDDSGDWIDLAGLSGVAEEARHRW